MIDVFALTKKIFVYSHKYLLQLGVMVNDVKTSLTKAATLTASFMDIKAALFGRPTSVFEHNWPGWLHLRLIRRSYEKFNSNEFVFKERIQIIKMRSIREKSAQNPAFLEGKMAKK